MHTSPIIENNCCDFGRSLQSTTEVKCMIDELLQLRIDVELRRNVALRIIQSCRSTIETLCSGDMSRFTISEMISIQLAWDCIIKMEEIVTERRLIPDSEWNNLLMTLARNMWKPPMRELHQSEMDHLLRDTPQWN
jgi:hypothetical protein